VRPSIADEHELPVEGRPAGAWDADDEGDDLWQRLSRVTYFLIVVVGLAVILVLFKPQIERREELKREVIALSDGYNQLSERVNSVNDELDWLRSDLNYLELEARDRLDLKKEGEHIIRIIRPSEQ